MLSNRESTPGVLIALSLILIDKRLLLLLNIYLIEFKMVSSSGYIAFKSSLGLSIAGCE